MIDEIKITDQKMHNEIMVTLEFQKNWQFDYLRFDTDDDDYVLYLNRLEENTNKYIIKRMWMKTACQSLRNKKIVFNDIEHYDHMIKIYFTEN